MPKLANPLRHPSPDRPPLPSAGPQQAPPDQITYLGATWRLIKAKEPQHRAAACRCCGPGDGTGKGCPLIVMGGEMVYKPMTSKALSLTGISDKSHRLCVPCAGKVGATP